MASACVTLKANTTHLANSEKGFLFGQDNGFLGERVKGAWGMNQLGKCLTAQKRVKSGAVSAVLTSNDAKEALVS